MLKKQNMSPDTLIQVKDVIKEGFSSPYFKSRELPYLRLWVDSIDMLTANCCPVYSGETLKVIRAPRRIEGINVNELETSDGIVGYTYWCEARSSVNQITEYYDE